MSPAGKLSILFAASAFSFLHAGLSMAIAKEPVELWFGSHDSEPDSTRVALSAFGQMLRGLSEGNVDVLFAADTDQLFPGDDSFVEAALTEGTISLAVLDHSRVFERDIFSLPFLFEDFDHAHAFMDRWTRAGLMHSKRTDIVPLALFVGSPRIIASRNTRVIDSPDALNQTGVITYRHGSQTYLTDPETDLFEKLGVSEVVLLWPFIQDRKRVLWQYDDFRSRWGESTTDLMWGGLVLEMGLLPLTVEDVLFSIDLDIYYEYSVADEDLAKVYLPQVSHTHHLWRPRVLVMSSKAWNALNNECQEVVRLLARLSAVEQANHRYHEISEMLNDVYNRVEEYVEPDRDEFRWVAREVWNMWDLTRPAGLSAEEIGELGTFEQDIEELSNLVWDEEFESMKLRAHEALLQELVEAGKDAETIRQELVRRTGVVVGLSSVERKIEELTEEGRISDQLDQFACRTPWAS